jgi:signal transduction histidine kinase/CheY-like chemotaxis protein
MDTTKSSFDVDLRISPKIIIYFLVVVGIVIFILSNSPSELPMKLGIVAFSFLILLSTIGAWLAIQKSASLGSWFIIVIVVSIIFASTFWLSSNFTLLFTFLPVALAAALISLPASGWIALVETIITIFLFFVTQAGGIAVFAGSITAVWLMYAIMAVVYIPVSDVSHWVGDYFNSEKLLLEEARSQRAELEQTNQDLSDAYQQLARLNNQTQNLRRLAEDARAAKEQFVANVSHELRTPLNMIIGYTDNIMQNPSLYGKKIPNGLLADLAVIQRNAEHLSHLINDILDLSQIETGKMALTKELVHFPDIIEFTVSAVQPLYKLKGLFLETELQPDLPDIYCDPIRIQEVLLNLVSNAGRFTDTGGIRIKAWQEDNNLIVSVSDTGPGIATEDLNRLFVPFEQLDSSIRKQYGGTGLGLVISKRFIEMHDGNIWVESKKGEGTTFTFKIPITIQNPPVITDETRWINPYMPYEQRLRLPRIPKLNDRPSYLVVENGDSFHNILKRYMGDVDIHRAEDMQKATHQLELHPVLALLTNIPSIRSILGELGDINPMNPDTPIIACSIPGLDKLNSQLNVADILVKPISGSQLIAALERLNIFSGTILIADDDPDALQLFGRILSTSKYSYRIRLARDGEEVLNILKECHPEAIFLDLAMPNISGYQLLGERSERSELADIPIIVISARDAYDHPIVSDMFLVTQKGGFSIRQLLTCIRLVSETLSPNAPSGDPGKKGDRLD